MQRLSWNASLSSHKIFSTLHPLRVAQTADHKTAQHSEGCHSIPAPTAHVSQTTIEDQHLNRSITARGYYNILQKTKLTTLQKPFLHQNQSCTSTSCNLSSFLYHKEVYNQTFNLYSLHIKVFSGLMHVHILVKATKATPRNMIGSEFKVNILTSEIWVKGFRKRADRRTKSNSNI